MADFLLFGTEGCHLCEDAGQLLTDAGLDFENRDIMDDEDSQQKYGLLIPVLWHIETRRQLNWPFGKERLREFIGLG